MRTRLPYEKGATTLDSMGVSLATVATTSPLASTTIWAPEEATDLLGAAWLWLEA